MTEATQEIAVGDVWDGEISVAADVRVVATRGGRRSRRSAAVMKGLGSLAEVIEREIAPHLARRQRTRIPAFCRVDAPIRIDASTANDSVKALADLVLGSDVAAARGYVERKQRSEGASLESLYVDLLTPVADYLGELWQDDRCDFTEVTLGLCHLKQLLRDFSVAFQAEARQEPADDRVFFAPASSQREAFDLSMVAEFFWRAGWDVWGGPLTNGPDPFRSVRNESFDLVCFSLDRDVSIPKMTSTIRALRSSARNRALGVIVVGRMLVQQPDLVLQLGADCGTSSGREAPARAREVVSRLRQGD